MAYIPPHKRRSKDDGNSRLLPSYTNTSSTYNKPKIKKHLKAKAKSRALRHRVYIRGTVSDQWFIEADEDDDDDQIPTDSIRLEPFLGYKSAEWERDGKPFVLVCDSPRSSGGGSTQPWVSITESIWPELLDSFENMVPHRRHGCSLVKPTLVAKIGNILFHKPPDSVISSSSISRSEAESALADVGKQFCTNLPDSHLEAVFAGAAPKTIADSYQPKEYYRVYVSDKSDPRSVISIKCRIVCGELKIQKIEKNQRRCFVADFSCLHKDLDLRLMLAKKRDLTKALKGDTEKLNGLRHLVDSAVVDGQVKGGLRWALGKEHSPDGRFSVLGVWHSTVRTFKNPSLKLRFVNADRFDFCTSDGEIGKEMTLVLKGINDTFIDRVVYMESALGRLVEALKFVWDHLLDFEQ
ncbi:hypothetical protein MKW94_025071 [Papaver nudicaule]|uniref:DUF7903 domain-containing protein n=1 Tax=Papaver nudicaule TaxID=74823 RepID=A0AA41VWD9_PAPNU|nr:hypothetical protein [Papaver nudicaule]